jgi:hypothetical protein
MIKELLNAIQRQKAKNLCFACCWSNLLILPVRIPTLIPNEILHPLVTPEFIAQSLDGLNAIIRQIMPNDYTYYYLATHKSILIDDIMETTSISNQEKEQEVRTLILRNMNGFHYLAKDLLAKSSLMRKKFEVEDIVQSLLRKNIMNMSSKEIYIYYSAIRI